MSIKQSLLTWTGAVTGISSLWQSGSVIMEFSINLLADNIIRVFNTVNKEMYINV